MQTQQAEERAQLIDRVLRLDAETYIYAGLGANVGLIYSDIDRDYERLDWMKWDATNIHRVAVAKAKSGALCVNPRYAEAFQVAFSNEDARQKSGIGANEQMIIGQLIARGLECTSENIQSIIGQLWDSLADNPQYTHQKTANDLRARRISDMTQGGTTGFSIQRGPKKTAYDKTGRVFDAMAGQAQGLSMGIKGPWSRGAGSKSFAEMSNEEVDALYQEWKATTDFRNMSTEELRKLVKSNGATDIFGRNVRAPSAPAPDSQDRLYHPATGEAFTQKGLIRYINAAPYNGRDLITKNGRIVPRLRQLFEQTVRGELG